MSSPASAPRVAFVTGAASGIGLAVVELLLEEGWRVAAADCDVAGLDGLRKHAGAKKKLLTMLLDVTDEAAVDAAIASAATGLGGLTGVVNSAGIAADIPALDTPVALYRKILDVNVIGSFLVARAAARLMKDSFEKGGGGGSIVNIASVSGLRGGKGRVAYGSSKAAVVVQTQVMANDLAEFGIRVNAIAPGPIETPMVQAVHTAADRETWMRYVPMKRYGQPRDIANMAAFLLDAERAAYLTGEVIAVDGGFRGAGILAT